MKKGLQMFSTAFMTATLACAAEAVEPIISTNNVRVWQTVFKPAEPLQWRWEDGATGANVTVSNALTGVVVGPVEVLKGGSGLYGQYQLPTAAEEALFDVTLEQVGESGVIGEAVTARLACLPGADGGGIVVERKGRSFVRMERPRLVAFDSEWVGSVPGSGSRYSFLPAEGGDPVLFDSSWSSGYFAQSFFPGGLQISFPGCVNVLEATLLARQGLAITIR